MNVRLLFLSLISIQIYSAEYQSVHDSTYWFYDEESSQSGWHIGTVRSNLVYGDKLRIAIPETNCSQIPAMYLTLSSYAIADIKNKEPNFQIESLKGKIITFEAYIDEYAPVKISTKINLVDESNSVFSIFFLEFVNAMPREFVSSKKDDPDSFIEVMDLKISKDDPSLKYFDVNEIQFRMGGLVNVWMHANQLCLDANLNTTNN